MKVKCSSFIVAISVVLTVFFVQKCDFTVINYSSVENQTSENSDVSTVCNISQEVEGYCVPIRSCLTLLVLLNPADVRARRCGPRNENLKNPFVCCEKTYLELESTTIDTVSSTRRLFTSAPIDDTVTTTQRTLIPPPPSQWAKPASLPESETVEQQSENNMNSEFPESKDPFEHCGVQEIETRIVGGNPSEKKEFPWLARLLRRNRRGDMTFSCTGALITSRVVLTTAHCLVSNSLVMIGDLYAVSLGEHETECDLDATECLLNKRTVIVSESIAHPEYRSSSTNHDNDIGLIILRDKVKFTNYISPICLLENRMEAAHYYLAGWGKTEAGAVSGVKLKISVPFFAWEQCAKKYTEIKVQLTSRQICAGGVEGMDSCQGDSGGPLMVRRDMKWYVAGVVSFGLGCGRKGWPGIYVYIPNYLEWIKETARGRVP